MSKDTEITKMIFRKYLNGEVIALMPDLPWSDDTTITCYVYQGQHGGADYNKVVGCTKLCTPAEYAPLKKELEGLGYNVKPMMKRTYKK